MGANKEISTGSIFVVDAKHMWLDDETVASNIAILVFNRYFHILVGLSM